MRITRIKILVLLISFGFHFSCSNSDVQPYFSSAGIQIIPLPYSISVTEEKFNLTPGTRIYFEQSDISIDFEVKYLKEKLNLKLGYPFEITSERDIAGKNNIISLKVDNQLKEEENYELIATENEVQLIAGSPAGLFYGIQTLRQLVTNKSENLENSEQPWHVPGIKIEDHSRFKWRGFMLDVARHFFSVYDVKKLIDDLSFYKINKLHLHLTDDQGWRIMIDKWPDLALIGGSTEVGGGEGGYYSQRDLSEIINYARDRHITVIPEIEMPGHVNAALASYGILNCDNVHKSLYTKTGVGFSKLCLEKEITYRFIEDVIEEIADIIPGEYIHLGGDETFNLQEQEYVEFISEIEKVVAKYDKKLIGWEEIASADLSSEPIIQHWQKLSYLMEAKEKKYNIILSPMNRTYLSRKYNENTPYGSSKSGFTTIQEAYIWEPFDIAGGLNQGNVIGVEAPVWTEYIENLEELEYMVYPRIIAISEIAWSRPEHKNWDDFKNRLFAHFSELGSMNVNYYRAPEIGK